jgi:hypothetical protein
MCGVPDSRPARPILSFFFKPSFFFFQNRLRPTGIFETGAIIPSGLVVKKATRKNFQISKNPKN